MTCFRTFQSGVVAWLLIFSFIPSPIYADFATADRLSGEAEELRKNGHYREAVAKAEQALAEADRANIEHDKPSYYAVFLHRLGTLYMRVDDYEKAELRLNRALEICRSPELGANLATTEALGELYRLMGRLDDAEPLLSKLSHPMRLP